MNAVEVCVPQLGHSNKVVLDRKDTSEMINQTLDRAQFNSHVFFCISKLSKHASHSFYHIWKRAFTYLFFLIKEGNKAATLTIGFGQRNVKNTSLIDNAGAAPVCLISETVSIDLDFIYMVFTQLEVLCWRAESHHIKEGLFL